MDPTRIICEIQNSFEKKENKYQVPSYFDIQEEIMSPRTRRNKIILKEQIKEEVKEVKKIDQINLPNDIANPFQTYPVSSKIWTKSATILANIDAIFNFTGQVRGYIDPQNRKDFDTAFLDAKIGYVAYLQYRLPASRIFTPCLKKNEDYQINLDSLNLNCDEQSIVKYVLAISPEGVDLAVSSKVSSKIDYKNNLIKALKICKPGGTFVCRIDETFEDDSLYYITSLCFEKISFFKPISEDLNSNFSYIIASNYKGNSLDWISILEETKDLHVFVPSSFLTFIKNYYHSLQELKKSLLLNPISYNLYKCKALWNIF